MPVVGLADLGVMSHSFRWKPHDTASVSRNSVAFRRAVSITSWVLPTLIPLARSWLAWAEVAVLVGVQWPRY